MPASMLALLLALGCQATLIQAPAGPAAGERTGRARARRAAGLKPQRPGFGRIPSLGHPQ
jgi:hypothetical protein